MVGGDTGLCSSGSRRRGWVVMICVFWCVCAWGVVRMGNARGQKRANKHPREDSSQGQKEKQRKQTKQHNQGAPAPPLSFSLSFLLCPFASSSRSCPWRPPATARLSRDTHTHAPTTNPQLNPPSVFYTVHRFPASPRGTPSLKPHVQAAATPEVGRGGIGPKVYTSSHQRFSSRTCCSSSGVKSLVMLNVLCHGWVGG